MKGFKNCDLDFTTGITNIKKLIKGALVKGKSENWKGNKKDLDLFINTAMDHLSDYLEEAATDRKNLNAITVDNLKGKIKREIIDILNTYKTANENIEFFKAITANAKNKSTITNAVISVFQRTDNLTRAEGTVFNELIDTALSNVETGGVRSNAAVNARARKLFSNAIAGGDELNNMLMKRYDIQDPGKAIFMAFKQGSSKIPELDVLARAFKFIDDAVTKRVNRNSPYFNILKDHVLPIGMDAAKIESKGYEFFRNFVRQRADLDSLTQGKADKPKVVEATIKGMYDGMITDRSFAPSPKFKSTTNLFGHRKIHFKSAEFEYDFLKEFGDLSNGVIGGALNHRRSLLKKTVLYNLHGANIEFNMFNLARQLEGLGFKPDEARAVILKHSDRIKTQMGLNTPVGATAKHINQGLSNLVSASLTGSSAVRNIAYDNSIHTALVSAMLRKNSILTEYAKVMWGFTKSAINNGQTNQVAKILESQGIAARLSQYTLYKGHMDEALAATQKGNKNARKFEQLTASAAEGISKYGAADWTFKASRVNQSVNAGSLLLDTVKIGFDELPPAVRASAEHAGFTKADWDVLKSVQKLSFEGKDLMIDVHKFSELDDKAVDLAIRPLETNADAKRRIGYAYQQMSQEMINELSPITSLRGEVVPLNSQSGLVNGILGGIFKFSNIALSQYYNMLRVMHKANGMNPNAVGHFNFSMADLAYKNPKMTGQMILGMAIGGMSTIWIKDILNGKTPREVTPEAMYQALSSNGAGGLMSLAANSLYYDDDVVSTPYSAYIRPLKGLASAPLQKTKKGEKAAREALRLSKRIIPGADLWYVKGAVDLGIRKGIGIRPTSHERRRMRENEQEFIIK